MDTKFTKTQDTVLNGIVRHILTCTPVAVALCQLPFCILSHFLHAPIMAQMVAQGLAGNRRESLRGIYLSSDGSQDSQAGQERTKCGLLLCQASELI